MGTAKEIISLAKSWIGKNEADGSHKTIIDIYNSHKPLARGYKVKCVANDSKTNDAWCATFISALAIQCNATDIIPTECGCGEMIKLCQKMGIWVENENRVPKEGDIIFYDWQDDGKSDNKGWSDHVGIVEKVNGNTITVIEGNVKDAVGRRTIAVNGRYIRGYAVPKYEVAKDSVTEKAVTEKPSAGCGEVSITLNELQKGSKGKQVKALQCILVGYGYDLGEKPLDGDFGGKTDAGVRLFQKNNGLTVDGIVGVKTWTKLLKT